MTLLITIVTTLPLGFFVRTRATALAVYLVAVQLLFTFQTAGLILDWGGGDKAAFGGPFPEHSLEQYWGYGVINLIIVAAGVGLVFLGARLRQRRLATSTRVELAR